MGMASRNIASIAGFTVNTTFPGIQNDTDAYMPYAYSVAGFGVPFLLLAVLLILYFIIGCICSICPCCWSKEGKPLGMVQIIIHIVLIVGMLISTAFFFVSAGLVLGSLDDVQSSMSGTNKTATTAKGVVNNLVDGATTLISSTVASAKNFIDNFGAFATTTFNGMNTEASSILSHLSSFESKMKDPGAGSFHTPADTFDTEYTDIYGACYDDMGVGTKPIKMVALGNAVSSGVTTVRDAATALTSMGTYMTDITNTLDDFKTNFFDGLETQVDDLLNTQIAPVKNQVDDLPAMIANYTDPVNKYINLAKKYSTPVTFISASVIAAITILYGIVFFCNNKFAAGILCSFWMVGLLLTLIIILPSAIFAVLFYPIYEACPQMEPIAESFIGDQFTLEASMKDILTCSVSDANSSLYHLLSLKSIFDYKTVLQDYRTQIGSFTGAALDYDGTIKTEVDKVLNMDIENDFKKESILDGNDPNQLFTIYKDLTTGAYSTSLGVACENGKTTLVSATNVNSKIDSLSTNLNGQFDVIDDIKQNALSIRGFAAQIEPKFDETNGIFTGIVDEFMDSAESLIENGVGDLNCTLLCDIYTPAKNALCSSLLDGMSFWILSSMIMIACISTLSITLCRRRRAMGSNRVHSKGSSDGSYSSSRDLKISREDAKFTRTTPYNV